MLGRGRAGGSGRGGSSKKPTVLPNLAVAGKRENREQPETSGRGSSKSTKRGRGRGAGGRGGRGRGGAGNHRDSHKHVLIEQVGIFSTGLNDDGRHDRSKTDDFNEFNMVNFGRGRRSVKREDGAEGAMGSGGESKPAKTFEDEWVSDEEADNGDMRDLLKDDFISDLRCGSVMPLVLPLSDEAQFKSLLSRSVKKEEIDVDDEQFLQTDLKAENTNSQNGSQTEKTKKNQRRRIESDSESENEKTNKKQEGLLHFRQSSEPIVASSQKVAKVLVQMEEEPSDDLILVQLPSTLLSLSNSNDEKMKVEEQVQNTTDTPSAAVKTEVSPPNPTTSHCLERFEDGTALGKLRIRKSGRVELIIGGMALDVTCGIRSRHNESVVLIETDPRPLSNTKEKSAASNLLQIKAEPLEETREDEHEKRSDNMFVIGKIGQSMVCSHDFAKSIEQSKLERKRKSELLRKPNEEKASGLDEAEAETKKLVGDLKSMELKEKSWAKWTQNYLNYAAAAESMDLDDSSS